MATSAPVPMATPTSAWASAGASLMPSPTMATRCPWACSASMTAALSPGSTSAWIREGSMPTRRATDSAVARSSPVSIQTVRPCASSVRIASMASALIGSAMASIPASRPSIAT